MIGKMFTPDISSYVDKVDKQVQTSINRELNKKRNSICSRIDVLLNNLQKNNSFYSGEIKRLISIRQYVMRTAYFSCGHKRDVNSIELLFHIFGEKGQPRFEFQANYRGTF